MGFAASLHPLSLAGLVRASALRAPRRAAVVEGDRVLSYAALMAALPEGRRHASPVVRWLATETEGDSRLENPRHRALILRALDNIVEHPVFERDGASASALPPESEMGAVAATVSMLLGGTLHVVNSGAALAEGVGMGRFATCWLDRAGIAGALPRPADGFRLALCDGTPSPELVRWLGPDRLGVVL